MDSNAGNKVTGFYLQVIITPLFLPFDAGLGHSFRRLEESCRSAVRGISYPGVHPALPGEGAADSNVWAPWKEVFARPLPLISRELVSALI